MVVRTIEILLEFFSIILCIHRVAGKKIKFNRSIMILGCIDLIGMILISYGVLPNCTKLLIFISILIYTKVSIIKKWDKVIKAYGTMLIVIMTSQIVLFYLLRLFAQKLLATDFVGIVINFVICALIFCWKKRYGVFIVNLLNSTKGIIILILYIITLIRIIQLNDTNGSVAFEMSMQFLIETFGLSVASIMWLNAEARNEQKAKEISLYEMYNHTFEQTIETIRIRQHEFENHINAIRCLHYTTQSYDELVEQQAEYCNNIIRENEVNKLLKYNLNPVLVGFLYSKISSAKEKAIDVEYCIQQVNIKAKIEVHELIELIGILFDNAVEALEYRERKIIILNLRERNNELELEIANVSRVYTNNELEQFCCYGYSTKGDKRGMGLTRVKEIVNKYNADFEIRNIERNNENYLNFRVEFYNRPKGY